MLKQLSKWTRDEDRAIKHYYPYGKWLLLLQRCPRRSVRAIQCRAQKLGVRQYQPWTPAEDSVLHTYYGEYSAIFLKKLLPGRSWAAIRARATTLNVPRLIAVLGGPLDEIEPEETDNGETTRLTPDP
jgi:hypothetical protein